MESGEREPQQFHDLSFISLDITKSFGIDISSERQIRPLIKEIGMRTKEWINQFYKKPGDVRLYCISGEYFYLLLKNISQEHAQEHAYSLQGTLREYTQNDKHISSLLEDMQDAAVKLHMVVVGYTYEALQDLLKENPIIATMRVKIMQLLDSVLKPGKEDKDENILVWHSQEKNFIRYANQTFIHSIMQLLDKQLIQQFMALYNLTFRLHRVKIAVEPPGERIEVYSLPHGIRPLPRPIETNESKRQYNLLKSKGLLPPDSKDLESE